MKNRNKHTKNRNQKKNLKLSGNGLDEEALQMLIKNEDKLAELLNGESNITLPRYRLPGYKISKHFRLSHKLEEPLREFCHESDITQREIMEIALIEAL